MNPKLGKTTDLNLRLCWNNPALNWHITNVFNCGGTVYPLGTDAYGRSVLYDDNTRDTAATSRSPSRWSCLRS